MGRRGAWAAAVHVSCFAAAQRDDISPNELLLFSQTHAIWPTPIVSTYGLCTDRRGIATVLLLLLLQRYRGLTILEGPH